MELILDLVANVEDGQHLAVANVAPPKSTLTGLTNQRALQLQAKQQQLQAPTMHSFGMLHSNNTLLTSHWAVTPLPV